jgi:hypothetical protein
MAMKTVKYVRWRSLGLQSNAQPLWGNCGAVWGNCGAEQGTDEGLIKLKLNHRNKHG